MLPKLQVKKICYVCGLLLDDYPYDPKFLEPNFDMICPCCGTHYGYDDEGAGEIEIPDELVSSNHQLGDLIHKKILKILRDHWVNNGMKWWSQDNVLHPKPPNWNPIQQLKNIPNEINE